MTTETTAASLIPEIAVIPVRGVRVRADSGALYAWGDCYPHGGASADGSERLTLAEPVALGESMLRGTVRPYVVAVADCAFPSYFIVFACSESEALELFMETDVFVQLRGIDTESPEWRTDYASGESDCIHWTSGGEPCDVDTDIVVIPCSLELVTF